MPYTDRKVGVDVTAIYATTDSPDINLGETVRVNGVEYVFLRANGAIGAKVPVAFETAFDCSASGNGGNIDGVSGDTALADNERAWFATRGFVDDVNVAAGTAAGAALSAIADANGDFVTVSAVDEGSTGTYVSGELSVRAVAMTAIASNVADIYLR